MGQAGGLPITAEDAMDDRSDGILQRIGALEAELEDRLETQRRLFRYTLDRKRVTFEAAARAQHKKLRTGLVRFLWQAGLLRLVAGIVIYIQIVPLLLVDLAVTVYHAVCFPIFGIAKVARGDYIVIDRHRLAYLNAVEKLNCLYCSYANGLLAYTREIVGRTEEHFCPIKHARTQRGQHRRYYGFADYGDADGFRKKMSEVTEQSDALRRTVLKTPEL
jgi:hypothetical protein